MTTNSNGLTVAIDTTADVAGIALFDGGMMLSELTWYSRQSHSRDLLPSLEWLLGRARRNKHDITRVAVCLGPGSYAGMRVGVTTAKTLAYGLGAKLIGVGRLEADALPFADAGAGRIVPVHAAGRAELAWAAYEGSGSALKELIAPGLSPLGELPSKLLDDDLIVGDIATLPAALKDALAERRIRLADAVPSRVIAVGRIGLQRFEAGESDDEDSLAPMYLRAPAIGPQPPRD